MNIRPIHNESAYKAALKEISILVDLDPEVGTQEGDRLEIMATLVQAYEAQHFPIELPDPIEAIKFRMEQSGMSPKDLVPMIGRSNRVYEVLNRTRPLTLIMIRKLHEQMGIPLESLIKPIVKNQIMLKVGM
jgi:HTH-type transcriptional regulator / antitoxin HigA